MFPASGRALETTPLAPLTSSPPRSIQASLPEESRPISTEKEEELGATAVGLSKRLVKYDRLVPHPQELIH